ncbi:MAG: septal ring lytic transglycosylase RlpA family protein [Patescibacteria group bacterium]
MNWKLTLAMVFGLATLFITSQREKPIQAEPKQVILNVDGYQTQHSVVADTVGDFVNKELGSTKFKSIHPELSSKLESGDIVYINTEDSYPAISSVTDNIRIANEPEPEPEVAPAPAPAQIKPEVVDKPASKVYSGLATWYRWGDGLNTASRQFPRGTRLRVIAVNSGKTVDVVVNDYGPAEHTGVALDLNSVAFKQLAPLGAGKIEIEYFEIS